MDFLKASLNPANEKHQGKVRWCGAPLEPIRLDGVRVASGGVHRRTTR